MEQHDQHRAQKPGLPEAINPEIGNGALWETDPHLLNIRSVDPASSLDHQLLDETARQAVIQNWNARPSEPYPSVDPFAGAESGTTGSESDLKPPSDKSRRTEKRIIASTRTKSPRPDWLENDEDLILKEDPNKPREIVELPGPEPTDKTTSPFISIEGKRMRKAVKKAQKENKAKSPDDRIQGPHPPEFNLSPFTQWLKSLKGSEYVHPYEDDYGLDHLSGVNREGISETFADLLVAQGYKDRAMDMYKALMAKYPEKSSFFAAKIEALK